MASAPNTGDVDGGGDHGGGYVLGLDCAFPSSAAGGPPSPCRARTAWSDPAAATVVEPAATGGSRSVDDEGAKAGSEGEEPPSPCRAQKEFAQRAARARADSPAGRRSNTGDEYDLYVTSLSFDLLAGVLG